MFLNPERVSLPDIDVDIGHKHRDEVIAYVSQTYRNVAQIATYSLLHPKGAVRDICRVLDISYSDADILSKLLPDKMPDQSEVTLEKLFGVIDDPEAAEAQWGYSDASDLFRKMVCFMKELRDRLGDKCDTALFTLRRLEGVVRAVGIHAAGVLIAPSDVTDYCSIIASPGKTVCSLDMDDVDAYGLLKVDLLGLKTVTVLYETAARVGVDIDSVPLDDPAVYRLYCDGKTHGVFQLSGDGITHYARQVRPCRFSDLVDILALYRPGPLDAQTETGRTIADQYVYNRQHPDEIVYLHPDLEEILAPAYGVMVYQEQVMEVARKLAGYTMGQADELRKLIGKKKVDQFPAARDKFISGGVANGYSEELMQQLFDQIEKFGGYAFNKSHSCAYAYLSYQTAYLKAHYPVDYMCVLLSSETDSPDKTLRNVTECRRMGIPILPVDVNYSDVGFKVEALPDGTRAIRYALTGIKSIGQAVAEEVVKHQPYSSLEDFCKRVEGRRCHKKVMHILILAGLFDSFEPNRYKLLWQYLYDIRAFSRDEVDCPSPDDWSELVRYELDREFYGFALSGHPADALPNSHWLSCPLDTPFYLSGIVVRVDCFKDRKGREMATVILDTPFGECKVYLFSSVWRKYAGLFEKRASEKFGDQFLTKLQLRTMLVKRRQFINQQTIEAIKVYLPDEARAVWDEYLHECLSAPTGVRSRPLIRFYS